MSVLNDAQILFLCQEQEMISPYYGTLKSKDKQGNKVLSYGLSSSGYDTTLDENIYILQSGVNLDPKQIDKYHYIKQDTSKGYFFLPPGGFALGNTVEYFKMPKDVQAVCYAKSTYARCGLVVGVTPLEPGWEGQVTLEFSNTTQSNIKLYINEGICQFVFHKLDKDCNVSYADRNGKYQGQTGVTFSR